MNKLAIGTLIGIVLTLTVGIVVTLRDTPLQRCKSNMDIVRDDEDLSKELEKMGKTFDERVEENCKFWIKNGQRF